MLRRDRGRADDHLGAVRLEHVALVLADLVGADEDALVAPGLRDHRQPDAGVAGGRLDDRAAGLELAGGLGGLDHPGGDAVLHRAAGVEVLHLGQHERSVLAPVRRGQVERLVEPDQRGVADQVEERVRVLHPANLCQSTASVAWTPWGRPGAARKLASAAAYGGGGLSVLGAGLYGVLRAEAAARPAHHRRRRRRAAARRDRLVRPRPARPGDQDRAARRLERGRVRRRPGRGDPRRAAGQRGRGARRPAGLPARVRRRSAPAPPTSAASSTGRCRSSRTSR